jgi:tetratricopeptide (TPR) repeat protein
MTSSPLILEADSLFNNRQYDQAREKYNQASLQAALDQDNVSTVEALAMIARTYLITEKKEMGREYLDRAGQYCRKEEPLGYSRYLGVRGRFEWKDNELEKASATFKEMYQYCSDNKLHDRAIDAAHMVAIVGGPSEQVEWGLKGIAEAEAGNVTGWLGPLWNNLGWTYEHDDKYKESLDAYLKAREFHHKYSDEKGKLAADWAVGHAYRLLGNADSAAQWITPDLLAKFETLGDEEFQGWVLKELGEIAILRLQPESALSFLTRAEEKLRAADMPNWDAEGYKKLQELIGKLK